MNNPDPIVFVLGAGASHGDHLETMFAERPNPTPPPTALGFFDGALLERIGYSGTFAESDFPRAFSFIRKNHFLSESVGEGPWTVLDIEQIFTFLELERDFLNSESDRAAELTLIRNELAGYVRKILAMCTQNARGVFHKAMSEVLEVDDSVITFNWDLLADQELLHKPQYTNFSVLCLNRMIGRGTPVISGTPGRQGLFLKLHGSLSWYICSNAKCPGGSEIDLDLDAQVSLTRYLGMGLSRCQRCGADTTPVIVPPVLHKRVTDISLIKSTWGLALQRLQTAVKVFVVGFSIAPTDYYANWLLHSGVGLRDKVEVFIVNKQNDDVGFRQRMRFAFPHGYNSEFRDVDQLTRALPDLLKSRS